MRASTIYTIWGKRHVCRQSPLYASDSILPAHVSTFSLTSAQATINICFEWHLACTHLSWDSDICAEDSLSRPYIQYSLHTSHFFNRHLRGQTLIHALSGILHAHMSGLYVTDSSLPLRMTEKTFRMTKQGQHQDDNVGDIRMTRPFLNHRSFTPPNVHEM